MSRIKYALIAIVVCFAAFNVAPPSRAAGSGVVINEVDCHGNDWVEIGNKSSQTIDISGWWLSDKKLSLTPSAHQYTFPSGTRIKSHGLLVVEQTGVGNKKLPFGINCLAGGKVRIGYRIGVSSAIALIQEAVIPALPPGAGYGRLPNLTGGLKKTTPTKGTSNLGTDPVLSSKTQFTCKKGTTCIVKLTSKNVTSYRFISGASGLSLSRSGAITVTTTSRKTFNPQVEISNSFGSKKISLSIHVV